MNIITVDAGKFQTKGLYGSNGIRFRTKMEEVDNNIQTNNSNGNHHIQWSGKHYVIGDSAKYVDYDVSKHKLQHKLATYIACTTLVKDQIASPLNLVVLSPLTLYTNIQAREEFRQFILNNNRAEFELNGEEVELKINDVTIFAEACGVPMSNINKFKNKTVGLFDIGGLNVNGVIIKDMKPVKGTHFTENLGSLIIMDKIRKELNKEIKGANIQEYQMDSILKQGYYLGDIDISREIINSLLADHFQEILQIAKASNWDTKGLDIVAAGGGSMDLGLSNIQSHMPQAQTLLTEKLSQIAKFDCKIIISCHYLGQIPIIRNELTAANTSYMLISGTDKKNYAELKEELQPYELEDLMNLKQYESLNLIKTRDGYGKFITKLPPPINSTVK